MRKPNKLWNCETAMLKMGKGRSWQLDRFSADDEAASNMCVCVFFSQLFPWIQQSISAGPWDPV